MRGNSPTVGLHTRRRYERAFILCTGVSAMRKIRRCSSVFDSQGTVHLLGCCGGVEFNNIRQRRHSLVLTHLATMLPMYLAQVGLSVHQALIQHAMTLCTDHGFGSHMNYGHFSKPQGEAAELLFSAVEFVMRERMGSCNMRQ